MDRLNRLLTWLAETVWPVRCIACGKLGAPACAPCLHTLRPLTPQRCPGCQKPSRDGIPCSVCRARVTVDRVCAATPFTEAGESFIYGFKYRGIRALAGPLAERICDIIQSQRTATTLFGSNPLIIPVPLHPGRLRERGFNQAELLAKRIANVAAMDMSAGALSRSRPTGRQVRTANRSERRENMQGAFSVIDRSCVHGRDILLVDDVVTTGATLEDCARALKEAGARSVSALTFAHG